MLIGPQTTFLECNVIFLAPATVVALQMHVKIPFLCLTFYRWQLFFRQAKTALSEKVRLCWKSGRLHRPPAAAFAFLSHI